MASYLITGASRGLGLEFTRQLVALPVSQVSVVFSTVRSKSPDLEAVAEKASGRVVIIPLDAADKTSIQAAEKQIAARLGDKGLDFLINNAGISQHVDKTENMSNLEGVFATNVLGPHYVTSTFLPLLRNGTNKKICNVSSTVGSIAYAPSSFMKRLRTPAYKVTKAALNMLTVQYANDLQEEGFTVIALSPGWLRTDLGGPHGEMSVEEGAIASLKVIHDVKIEQTGQFFNYDGKNAEW